MFRAYGSLPPSECSSPLSPTAPFLPSSTTASTTTTAPEWMTTLPSSVVEATPALLGRSLSLFETVTASVEGGDSGQMFHHHQQQQQQQRRPELRRHWSSSSGERTTGTAGSGFDGGENGDGDDDGCSVGLSNLLASARFFKTDRTSRGRIRGDAAKGFLNCNTNTLQSLAQLHGKLDFHEFIPGKPFFSGLDEHISDDAGGFIGGGNGGGGGIGGNNHHQHSSHPHQQQHIQ